MFQIGDIQIVPVSDGITHVDAGGPFGLVPRALYSKILMPDANNLIPMNLTCLLVRAAGKTLVIDTALGEKLNTRMKQNWNLIRPRGGLLDNLAANGVRAEDVDVVVDTHLHSDHCSGNTAFLDDSETSVRPTFPNAEYIAQRREYEDAMHPNERTRATYFPINYDPLVQSGQMRLIDSAPNEDVEIVPGVYGVVTPGHTPGHMAVRFESNGQHALFVADLASYAVHFERLGWMTSYDVEPLRTLETKRIWQQWALDHDATIFFQHDAVISAGKLRQKGDRLEVDPIGFMKDVHG
jgi:glyoxylase-like metal-dependent hydrolase (beta-lactamase superfamily II)